MLKIRANVLILNIMQNLNHLSYFVFIVYQFVTLSGITQKLDHFVDLGIETLWVGPFFKSSMDDAGYDVEEFFVIDSMSGTMDGF